MLIKMYTNNCVFLCIYDMIYILMSMWSVDGICVCMHVVEGIFIKRNVGSYMWSSVRRARSVGLVAYPEGNIKQEGAAWMA
jgi:hypothetical protein